MSAASWGIAIGYPHLCSPKGGRPRGSARSLARWGSRSRPITQQQAAREAPPGSQAAWQRGHVSSFKFSPTLRPVGIWMHDIGRGEGYRTVGNAS